MIFQYRAKFGCLTRIKAGSLKKQLFEWRWCMCLGGSDFNMTVYIFMNIELIAMLKLDISPRSFISKGIIINNMYLLLLF